MKTFESENFYRILQVPPNACMEEIKHAYREAMAIYEDGSAATYALFSDSQRKTLLRAIERAYATLIDENKRAAYNQMLIDSGQVVADDFCGEIQRKLAASTDDRRTSNEERLSQWVFKKAGEPEIKQLIESLEHKELLSGFELKQLREAYGIELTEIYAITRINADILTRIETNQFDDLPAKVYLRHFLKTYAELLHLDPARVADSYLKCMHLNQPDH